MAAEVIGALWTLGGIAFTALLGWIGTVIAKRTREPMRIETLWTRLDAQDAKIEALNQRAEHDGRKLGAAVHIIRDLARQWTGPIPKLNPSDLDEMEQDTIPLHWILERKSKP